MRWFHWLRKAVWFLALAWAGALPGAASDSEPASGPTFLLSERQANAVVRGQVDEEGRALVFAALAAEGKSQWEAVHLLLVAGERVEDQGIVRYRKGSRGPDLELGAFGLARWEPVVEDTWWGMSKPGGGSSGEVPPEFAIAADRYGLVRAVMTGSNPERGSSWNLGGPTGNGAVTQGYEELLTIIRQLDGNVDRFMFGLEDGAPILSARIAVEDSGAVHALFERDVKADALRYARLPPELFRPASFFESAWRQKSGDPRMSFGLPIGERRSMRLADGLALAADPGSGRAMMATIRSKPDRDRVFTRTVHEGKTGPPVPIGGEADAVLLAAGGRDTFHALVHDRAPERGEEERIVYLRWSDDEWSPPVVLGGGEALGALLADRNGHALAIWQEDGRLTGRWVGP